MSEDLAASVRVEVGVAKKTLLAAGSIFCANAEATPQHSRRPCFLHDLPLHVRIEKPRASGTRDLLTNDSSAE